MFLSIPQPLGAGIAYVFVLQARQFLPVGFGLAAGAMVFLVLHDLFPDALDHARGAGMVDGGKRELVLGVFLGFAVMIPIMMITA